jgi:hypothetical protein
MAFNALPKPKSLLGYHRNLAPSAAVKVSPLCIGELSFGMFFSRILIDFFVLCLLHRDINSMQVKLCNGPLIKS